MDMGKNSSKVFLIQNVFAFINTLVDYNTLNI